MLKTILKTLALSATALTLLSACGAATRAFDDFLRGSDSSGVTTGTTLAPDCYYAQQNDIDCNLDPRLCEFNCPLSAKELLALKAQFIKEGGLGYELYAPADHLLNEDSLRASAAKLKGEERIRADEFIADFVAAQKSDALGSAAAHLESEIKKTSLSEEQTRWQRLELWNVKNKPATTAPHAVSVTVTSVTPAEDNIRRNRTATKTNTTFGLVFGGNNNAIMTINGVDYEIVVDSYYNGSARYIPNPNRKVSNNLATLSSSGAYSNIRRIVHGIHPTVQGDYFTYRTNTDGGDYYNNDNYIKGVATMGIQTDAAVVQSQTAVAIYRGEGSLNAYESTYSDSIVGLAITMKVDFDANIIQGTGMGTYYDGSYFNYSPANMTFNSAPIVGNGFSGTFTMNSELREWYNLTDNPTGQYSGNFFGPNADDLAGVMQFNGTTNYSEIVRIGGFRADRTVIQGFEE